MERDHVAPFDREAPRSAHLCAAEQRRRHVHCLQQIGERVRRGGVEALHRVIQPGAARPVKLLNARATKLNVRSLREPKAAPMYGRYISRRRTHAEPCRDRTAIPGRDWREKLQRRSQASPRLIPFPGADRYFRSTGALSGGPAEAVRDRHWDGAPQDVRRWERRVRALRPEHEDRAKVLRIRMVPREGRSDRIHPRRLRRPPVRAGPSSIRIAVAMLAPETGGHGARFSPELFRFLRQLERHNERAWFEANRERYERFVRRPMLSFIAELKPRLSTII